MPTQARLTCWLLIAIAACAGAPPAAEWTTDHAYAEPIVLLVSPDSAEVERMHGELGADFEVVADDAMWYRAEARQLLDSLRIPYAEVGRGEARFHVAGRARTFSWRQANAAWFAVVYDGRSAPVIIADADLREHLPPLRTEVGRR